MMHGTAIRRVPARGACAVCRARIIHPSRVRIQERMNSKFAKSACADCTGEVWPRRTAPARAGPVGAGRHHVFVAANSFAAAGAVPISSGSARAPSADLAAAHGTCPTPVIRPEGRDELRP